MIKNNKIEKYLEDYSKIAEKWIGDRDWLQKLYISFKEFFIRENIENADWQYFQKLKNEKLIHSFNALPLAGQRALGEINHPIEHYRKVFLYLKYGDEADNIRFNNLVDKNSGYSLSFFGKSAISELIGQAFPEKYVFYNSRDIDAIKFLGLDIDEKNKKFGDFYVEYNDLILKNIVPKYNKLVKTKFDSLIPIGLRIDQFFSWLYEEQIFKKIKEVQTDVKPKGKITKIKIQSFNQFKNFTLDLTYPPGFIKDGILMEGKPLEKVCFIGQSGSGKTTLLNIIRDLTSLNLSNLSDLSNKNVEIEYSLSDKDEIRKIEYKVSLINGSIKTEINKVINSSNKKGKKINEIETQIGAIAFPTLMYFPSDIISQINVLNKVINEDSILNSEYSFKEDIIDFSSRENNIVVQKIWNNLLLRIQQYQEQVNTQKVIMANTILANQSNQQEALNQFNEWKKYNHHPIEDLSQKYLNKFLYKFNLKINTDTELSKVFFFEPLYESKEIKPELLSTGTKQIILRTLPFYSLWDSENETGLPRNSLILMDEPENSLYPDIQRVIVDYFQSLTENSQFFYATHSPIIASCFEPCERFILNFNNGFVEFKKGVAPKGTHSNEILKSEYETELLGEEGLKMWNRFIELPKQISLRILFQGSNITLFLL